MACPDRVVLGQKLTMSIRTHDPDTGVVTDAESAPTYRIYEEDDGEDAGDATAVMNGTLVNPDTANLTGAYKRTITVSAGNGFSAGKNYTIYYDATVDGDTGGHTDTFRVVSVEAGMSIVTEGMNVSSEDESS